MYPMKVVIIQLKEYTLRESFIFSLLVETDIQACKKYMYSPQFIYHFLDDTKSLLFYTLEAFISSFD